MRLRTAGRGKEEQVQGYSYSGASGEGGGYGGAGAGGAGLQPNVAGLLCYLLGWITGLIFLLIEKENRFVRFHAAQSILFSLGLGVLWIALAIFFGILSIIPGIRVLGALLSFLAYAVLGIGGLVLWILLMVRAYQGQRWELPVVGAMAARWAG